MFTLEEVKSIIKTRLDEVTILEILEIDSEMLVERFSDLIEDRLEKLERDFCEE